MEYQIEHQNIFQTFSKCQIECQTVTKKMSRNCQDTCHCDPGWGSPHWLGWNPRKINELPGRTPRFGSVFAPFSLLAHSFCDRMWRSRTSLDLRYLRFHHLRWSPHQIIVSHLNWVNWVTDSSHPNRKIASYRASRLEFRQFHQDLGRADQTSAWFQVAIDAVVSSAPGLRKMATVMANGACSHLQVSGLGHTLMESMVISFNWLYCLLQSRIFARPNWLVGNRENHPRKWCKQYS